ncbi:MAG: fumarylacetoacetate hydrolase family protein, partial [Thermoplasmata archaeon]
MKLVHFLLAEQFHFGMITDANEFIDLDTACRDYFGVNPVKGADPSRFRDMRAFFSGGPDSVELTRKIVQYIERRRQMGWTPRAATGARYLFKAEEGVHLLAPVVNGSKIYCLASNSRSHLAEQGKSAPPHPYFFTRFFNSLVGPSEPLRLNPAGQRPDVELELAIVIGKRGRNLSADRALEHVAGYTIALDMAYRDLQYPPDGSVDWVMGKGFDATMAVGPWIVPKEEVGDPYPLRMELKVAGELWQQGDSSDYLFRIPRVLEHLTRGVTVEPGDLISL